MNGSLRYFKGAHDEYATTVDLRHFGHEKTPSLAEFVNSLVQFQTLLYLSVSKDVSDVYSGYSAKQLYCSSFLFGLY